LTPPAAHKARKPAAVEVDKEKYKGTVAKNFLRAKQVEYESMLRNKQTKTT
jgi:hypothetical protein